MFGKRTRKPFAERRCWYVEHKTTDGPKIEAAFLLPRWICHNPALVLRKKLLPMGLAGDELKAVFNGERPKNCDCQSPYTNPALISNDCPIHG